MPNTHILSDALRRLLVVIGCVVLATAQPMSAFASETAEPQRSPDTVIYPKAPADKAGDSGTLKPDSGPSGTAYLVVVLLLAGAGVWFLWRRKKGEGPFGGAGTKKLLVEETKSLGNRQYLVVASYEGKKFLLGVTSERIELLTHLSEEGGPE
jgi:flagellar protein FliO/FliZ